MFAGKTSRIQEEVKQVPEDRVVAVKPSIDNRYSEDRIVNHDEAAETNNELVGIAAVLVDRNNPNLRALVSNLILLLAIDETNFFNFDTLWPEVDAVLESGINVVAAGLIYDVLNHEFGATKKLIAKATLEDDEVIELMADCYNCGAAARNTISFKKDLITEGNEIVVGGADLYAACCDDCLKLRNI